MSKKDLVIFIVFGIALFSYLKFAGEKEVENEPAKFLVSSSKLKSLQKVRFQGNYKNFGVIYRDGRNWYWDSSTKKAYKVDPTYAFGRLLKVQLGEEVEEKYIPKDYFESASEIELYFEKQTSLFRLSSKKSVTGQLYLELKEGESSKFYLVASRFEDGLKPSFVNWIGSKLFDKELGELSSIEYEDETGKVVSSILVSEDQATFRKGEHSLVLPKENLVKKLQAIQLSEVYDAQKFNLGELIDLGINLSGESTPKTKLNFVNGESIKIIKSSVSGKSSFMYLPQRELLASSIDDRFQILLENFVSLIDLESYHREEWQEVEKIECSYAEQDKQSFVLNDKKYFSNQKVQFKLKDLAHSVFGLKPVKLHLVDGVEKRLQYHLKILLKNRDSLEFDMGYYNEDLLLYRRAKPYYYELAEYSKSDFGNLIKYCYGRAINE